MKLFKLTIRLKHTMNSTRKCAHWMDDMKNSEAETNDFRTENPKIILSIRPLTLIKLKLKTAT